MHELDPAVRTAAERVLDYLAETDVLPLSAADAIIGFGVFDLMLPRFCGELHARGVAPRIIFTGGFGAGTGRLTGTEAEVWREELRRSHPTIPDRDVILENRSTNTAENIAFTADLLAREHRDLAFGRGVRSAIIVASPSRLRRVQLTMRKLLPEVRVVRQRPVCSFDRERALYEENGVEYVAHLAGEIDRLVDYPARGWIAGERVPEDVLSARERLRPLP